MFIHTFFLYVGGVERVNNESKTVVLYMQGSYTIVQSMDMAISANSCNAVSSLDIS